MIQLPKIKRDPKETEDLCKCRPVCKSRRRQWNGQLQNTSAELLLERQPLPECFRRYPTKIYPNGPCPLFGRTRRITIHERGVIRPRNVVRICQAPIDNTVDVTYLRNAALAKRLGAWAAVRACCPFCECGECCICDARGYALRENQTACRRRAMKDFDARVKTDYQTMRIMYDVP